MATRSSSVGRARRATRAPASAASEPWTKRRRLGRGTERAARALRVCERNDATARPAELAGGEGCFHRPSLLGLGLRAPREGLDVAGVAQHLVDLAEVPLLLRDHLARVLLEHDRFARDVLQELLVERQAL